MRGIFLFPDHQQKPCILWKTLHSQADYFRNFIAQNIKRTYVGY